MLKLVCLALVAALAVSEHTYYEYDDATRAGMLGTRMDRQSKSQDHKVMEMTETEALEEEKTMPASFESATKWAQCADTINYIKDQAACGSCWAVAASSVMADRFCISCGYGAGKMDNRATVASPLNEMIPGFSLSAEELMSCCSYCGDGCQGGYPIDAMRDAYLTGYVSGAWFGSNCGCQQYKIAPVRQALQPTPSCKRTCDNGYPVSMNGDRHKASHYAEVRGQTSMKKEIMSNGPIECAFSVYQSFETFFKNPANKDKVYMGGDDRMLGGHAIKITGWGMMGSTPYWNIHNSWNTTWGNSGQFKYVRGKDLFGMESQCVMARASCPKSPNMKTESLECKGRDF